METLTCAWKDQRISDETGRREMLPECKEKGCSGVFNKTQLIMCRKFLRDVTAEGKMK